jgi:hypothetical protein
MLKKEIVYLLISERFFGGKNTFTQKGISEELGFSISTINNALKPLVGMHAVQVKQRSFSIIDAKKFLSYWATIRKLKKDTIYSTFVPEKADKIEALMTSDSAFTAFSACKLNYPASADYSEIYAYSNNVEEIKKRFPPKEGPKNLFILKSNPLIEKISKNNCVPLPLVFVDLWNLPQWYAKEFLAELGKKLFGE